MKRKIDCRLATAALLLAALSITARADGAAVKRDFQITATSMVQALMQWTEQSGLQIVWKIDGEPEQLPSRPIVGTYTPTAALDLLLAGSGFQYEFVNPRTISIRSTKGRPTSANDAAENAPEQSKRLRLAQADTTSAPEGEGRGMADPAQSRETIVLDEVVVNAMPELLIKGSRSLNMDIRRTEDDSQPYVVFDRQTIERSSASTVQGFLRERLTSANASLTTAQGVGGAVNALINLRGLGTAQTLILVDGHRIASQSGNGTTGQPDINGIPLASIERIEILPGTASGIYGGGATGGAVNIIRRRDYDGMEAKVSYRSPFREGGTDRAVDIAGGINLEGGRTNILLSGSYQDATDLYMEDRDFLEQARALILENNAGNFANLEFFGTPPLGYTTNIRSVNGQNLRLKPAFGGALLSSSRTTVPVGYAGPSSDQGAGLIANAGTYNLEPAETVQLAGGGNRALVASPTRKSAAAGIRREFTSWMTAFLDLSVSESEGTYFANSVSGNFTLLASAAGNPFAQDVRVTTPTFGTDTLNEVITADRRGVVGMFIRLPMKWSAEVDYTWNQTRYASTAATAATLSTAAGTGVSSGAIDVFRDTNAFAVDFGQFLAGPTTSGPSHATLRDSALRFAGPLPWALPGGAPTLTFLAEHRQELLDDFVIRGPTSTSIAYSRTADTDSLYAEAQLPVLSAANSIPGIDLLSLDLKVRHDRYVLNTANQVTFAAAAPPASAVRVRNEFSSTDPTFGLSYKPLPDVKLRASYGTGFLPPALTQLVPGATQQFNAGARGLTDPRRAGAPLTIVSVLTGGNPDLRPETSESRSVGIIVTPRVIPDLRISADWVEIRKQDNVRGFAINQSTLNDELMLPGVITRGPASDGFDVGPITSFSSRWVNVANQNVEALDLALDYRFRTGRWGDFTFSAAGTRNLHNNTQVIATSPVVEDVDLINALKWTANANLAWDYRKWSVEWAARFNDSYFFVTNRSFNADQGSATIPSQDYHDIMVTYRFGADHSIGVLSDLDIQAGVKNVFDTSPPIVIVDPYYSTIGDPQLATYFVTIRKGFGN